MANTTHDLQLRAILDTSLLKQQIQSLNAQGSVNLDASGINNSLNALNQTIAKFTSSLEKLSQSTNNHAQKTNDASTRLFRFALGMHTQQLAGLISRYAESAAPGSGAMIGTFGNIAARTAQGYAAGGAKGAGIGFALGAVQSVFENLADSTIKAREALDKFADTLKTAADKDRAWREWNDQQRIKAIEARGTDENVRYEYSERIRAANRARQNLAQFQAAYGISDEASSADLVKKLQSPEALKAMTEKAQKDLVAESRLPAAVADKVINAIRSGTGILGADLDADALKEWNKAVEKVQKRLEELRHEVQYTTKAEAQLGDILDKRKKESQKESPLDKKAEEIIKKWDADDKRLKSLKQRQEQYFDKQYISGLVENRDMGALLEEMSRRQYLASQSLAKYKGALKILDVEGAEQNLGEYTRQSDIVSMLRDSIISNKKDEYSGLVDQLQKQLTPLSPVSQLQAMGGNMGWVDASTENIENNVQKITDQLGRLITEIRSLKQEQGTIIY